MRAYAQCVHKEENTAQTIMWGYDFCLLPISFPFNSLSLFLTFSSRHFHSSNALMVLDSWFYYNFFCASSSSSSSPFGLMCVGLRHIRRRHTISELNKKSRPRQMNIDMSE